MKHYEYTIRAFSMQDLKEKGIVVDPHNNIVFACRPDGGCAIRDVGVEQIDKLSGLFNEMGEHGWELVQLFFRPSGIVSFWKRLLREGD
ncbi:MAG: hypothetical protein NTU90_02415 [Proteobacteria bacterium]|jgi:hypothetical protein|nr:hypothetical protein [Pseudomonadota bacterium]